jgi:hypothetical protein
MLPSSYHAEGYGMLSILRFLFHVCQFCGTEPRCSQIYSDNLALINRIYQQLRKQRWYPNDTLSSEWDVLHAIVRTLSAFPILPLISHVKGHQDRHMKYNLLPLEAQLNVDADEAATQYQETYGSSRYQVPRITGNDAQLSINQRTVTYNYVKTLRNAYSYPCLLNYIGTKHQWSTAVLNTIDWVSLGLACNKNHKSRHFIVKMSHDLLPTRSRTKRYDNDTPSQCIYCQDTVEDRDHLIRCHHPTCVTWRTDLLRSIRKQSDTMETDPVLLDILMEGLYAWMHQTDPPTLAAYPAAYRRLVREQATLGWHQLFNGRWSTKWARLHDRYLIRLIDPIPNNLTGTKWTSTFIDLLWRRFRTHWDNRNGKVHGIDTSTRFQARRKKVHRELRAVYTLRQDMRHCDRTVFHDTVEAHLDAQPVWAIQNWLKIHVPMAKHSIKEAARLAVRNVRTITSYFWVIPPEPIPNMIEPSPKGPGREPTLPVGR